MEVIDKRTQEWWDKLGNPVRMSLEKKGMVGFFPREIALAYQEGRKDGLEKYQVALGAASVARRGERVQESLYEFKELVFKIVELQGHQPRNALDQIRRALKNFHKKVGGDSNGSTDTAKIIH